jgi:hypothetical protein
MISFGNVAAARSRAGGGGEVVEKGKRAARRVPAPNGRAGGATVPRRAAAVRVAGA